ncbi:MAG: sugar phosphate isomerase/epimerase [Chloroflexi bacterium]|nr:sugar phosphate isomerase/epimerase [Chloroflexota bacterium]
MAKNLVLGTNVGFANRAFPEPAAWAQIVARDLGLKEVQFSFDLLDPLLPEPGRSAACYEITSAVTKYGLTMHSTFTGGIIYSQNHLAHPNPNVRAQANSWYQGALQVTSMLGAEGCGGHVGGMSAADYDDPRRRGYVRSELIEAVRNLTLLAARLGQKYFLWEFMPSPREIPHTPEEAVELMQEVNEGAALPVYLCFDVGHCNSYDFETPGDPHAWLEKLLPYSPVVHLQQTDGKADHHWPFSREYDTAGIVKPQRIVDIVKSSPFETVYLLFEFGHAFDAPDSQVIDEHKQSVERWSKWL